MKTIIVMRHSKAEQKSPTNNDFDRRLKKKGVLATKNVASKIIKLGIVPDLIITSPVIRALSTAEIFTEYFDLKQNILLKNYLCNRLYTFNEIIDDIKTYNIESNTVLIIGHSPTISYLLKQINLSTNIILNTSSAVVFDFLR